MPHYVQDMVERENVSKDSVALLDVLRGYDSGYEGGESRFG